FSFPRNENLKKSWITAIKRQDFIPTKHSRVCINHFPIKDAITSLKAFNERTGELVQAPFEHKRLVPGAIPSLFPDLPKYFSSEPTTSRENPLDRATRKEMEQLKEAINKSIDEQAENAQLKKIRSYEDLINKFETFSCDDFLKVTQKNQLIFLQLDTLQAPKVSHSLLISSKLEARVYIGDQGINKLGNFSFPLSIDNSDTVIKVLDNVKNVSCDLKEKVGIKGTLQLICDLLKTLVNNSDVNSEAVNFLMEQVAFLGSSKFARRYSSDIMIFSSLMYTIAPSAYRFLRQSGYLVLPHPNTINNVCTKYSVSPQFEQLD
ncbi:hypothetical protein AVEN_171073-1, partial [Araneus ventricosus]